MEKIYDNSLNLDKALENQDECIEILKLKFGYEGVIINPETGFWVLKDGSILACGSRHSLIDLILIKKGYIINLKEPFTHSDGSQFMDKINAVRIRNEVTKWKAPAYLTLPLERMTEIQQKITFKWIEDVLTFGKTGLIVDTGFVAKKYGLLQDQQAIEDIKFYYRTGNFE